MRDHVVVAIQESGHVTLAIIPEFVRSWCMYDEDILETVRGMLRLRHEIRNAARWARRNPGCPPLPKYQSPLFDDPCVLYSVTVVGYLQCMLGDILSVHDLFKTSWNIDLPKDVDACPRCDALSGWAITSSRAVVCLSCGFTLDAHQ